MRLIRFFQALGIMAITLFHAQAMDTRDNATYWLFEGMRYPELCTSQVMNDPVWADVLRREGLLEIEAPTTPPPAIVEMSNNGKEPAIAVPVAAASASSVPAASDAEPATPRDIALLTTPTAQSSEVGLTSQDLDDALAEEFQIKKRRIMLKTLGRPLFLMSAEMLLLYFGTKLFPLLIPDSTSFASGMAAFAMLGVASGNVKLIFNILWYLYIAPVGDTLAELEDRYIRKKRFLLPKMQVHIERLFQDARREDQTGSKKEHLDRLLKLPVRSQCPEVNLNAIESLLKGYQDADRNPITAPFLATTATHLARFTERAHTNPTPKLILYLQGPPGIGKTRLVQEFAKAIGLPLISLQLSDENFKSTAERPGTLLQAITSQSMRNCVLFLDEVDRFANQEGSTHLNMLLPFLDPGGKLFFDSFLGTDIDISHYLLILAGNHPPNEEALLDRCIIVNTGHITPAIKEQSVRENMLPLLLRSENPTLNLMPTDLPETELRSIFAKNENDPGFRGIQKDLQYAISGVRIRKLKMD